MHWGSFFLGMSAAVGIVAALAALFPVIWLLSGGPLWPR